MEAVAGSHNSVVEPCSLTAAGAYNLVVVEDSLVVEVGAYNLVVAEGSPVVEAGSPIVAACNAVDQVWALMMGWLPHNWGI